MKYLILFFNGEINMKKQIIAAAVAASVSAVAMADVSITGNANYEWFSTTTGTADANYTADTEVNLKIAGKSGDTGAEVNLEFNDGEAGGANLDVEDVVFTTKVGDVAVTAGHYASGTTAFLGEIDSGARTQDKLDLSTTMAGWKVSFSQAENTTTDNIDSDGSAITVSGKVADVAVTIKEASDSYTAIGAAGSLAGINYRIENKDADAANSDVLFVDLNTKVGGATVGYTVLDADSAGKITEGDSGIFGLSVSHVDGTLTSGTSGDSDNRGNVATGAKQLRISAPMAGNTLSAKIGTIEDGLGAGSDLDFTELKLTRALASGATLNVVFDDYDDTTSTSTEVIEIDLSVKF